MQKISFRDMTNQVRIQRLQDKFCRLLKIAAYCLDAECNPITTSSGGEAALEILQNNAYAEQIADILERVKDDSLEEQVVESLNGATGHMAAIAVRVEGITAIYWVIYDPSDQEDEHFYHILDVVRDVSQSLFANKLSLFSAEAESRRSRFAEQEMSKNFHALEATTEIVQLLDSDEQIELVMDKWLSILSEYIQVDTSELFQISADGATMDVVCEWCKPGRVSYFDKTSQVATYSFLHTDKPLIISTDNTDSEYYGEIQNIGMKAVIIFPILTRENGRRTLLSLNHREKHTWSVEEIKFTADAAKILQSILTRRIQKESLASSYIALEAVLDNVGSAVSVADKLTGKLLFANRRAQNTFAKELSDDSFREILERGVQEGKEGGVSEIYHVERERWYDLIYKEIAWVGGERAMLYSLYDTTDKKIYQKRIEQQAYTDFLTGLYNRMCCERDLARQIDAAEKSGTNGALLYMDLDDFKHINDGLGHQYGDALLKAISHSLQMIEGIQDTCYRMGGDEFVIIIPPGYYYRFDEIVEDIKAIFSKPWFLKDADYYCTMSMGIVEYPEGGESVTELIRKADIAMYEAKKHGKNRVSRYSDIVGEGSGSGKRLDMEKNMRDAAGDGCREFMVYYQPIIDIQKGETVCVGAEALVRWNSDNLGFVPPSEFIPLAEYLGLINPIGNHVLTEACRHCKEWNDNGYPDYWVDVNLSVVQLLQPDIVEIVERTLQETGLEPGHLTLEVTESLAINDMERMKDILGRIKALGVQLALDDFGTGYSSLNHIREIPLDVIKVDQTFVKSLAADVYSQSFIKMVSELAATIGVSICVEGIETEAQYKVLQDMKVKYVQGYYFDRPMPQAEFESKYVAK